MEGKVFVMNTDGRCKEFCDDLHGVIEDGRLQGKQTQRLGRRMHFAEAQLSGRTGKRCLRVLSDFAEGRGFNLAPKDIFFLRMFRDLLLENVPREVYALKPENVVVFTDACYERDNNNWPCGLGGVVCAGNLEAETYVG